MNREQLSKLTLAGLFAAMAFICFSYLRLEIPMGLGMTGKFYIGHTFIMLSALLGMLFEPLISVFSRFPFSPVISFFSLFG